MSMLQQVLVISPYGMCPLYRNYKDCATDPHLISAFVGAVIPHMQELGFTQEKIEHEMIEDENSYMEFTFNNSWIYTGIADRTTERTQVRQVLGAVCNTVSSRYSDPEILFKVSIDEIQNLEEEIDILVAQKGIAIDSQNGANGFLPIIKRVQDGQMKPGKAAQLLLDALKDDIEDDNTRQNILTSLKMIDQLMSMGSKKLDSMLELVRATYKNVSKYVVRLDHALDF